MLHTSSMNDLLDGGMTTFDGLPSNLYPDMRLATLKRISS